MPAALLAFLAAAVIHVPVLELKAARGHGKIFGAYESPDKHATLIYSSDSTGGDFPQSAVYVQTHGHLFDLGNYRRVTKVTWAKDGKSVTFEGSQLKDYGVDDVVRITFRVGAKQLDKVILKQIKDEPTG
ncbi:MAG: hypothetical protein JWM80_3684 [Cyanobacteria bacterium RYN_339]|nr:hypothetical protein [Cyanobacteria bacterium RYN_339]